MAILAGIDEAGLGPLLGPLVVSSSVFSVDPSLLEADLWQTFKRSVGGTRKHLGGRLLITDSKKAFQRADGLGHLERTVRAALLCLGKEPGDLQALLSMLCPEVLSRLPDYPWYADLPRRTLPQTGADLRIAARVLAEDAQAHGVELLDLRTSCLDVGFYNRMVDTVRNKSQVLFFAATQLVQRILTEFPDETIHILVDRQGGRAHYREHLLRSFPGMDLAIECEGPERSTYDLRREGRLIRLTFEVKADGRYLPVAMASMVSKYIRELLMEQINAYFSRLDAGLKPTAGYWKDGQRFVADLRRRLPSLEIDDGRLIRCR